MPNDYSIPAQERRLVAIARLCSFVNSSKLTDDQIEFLLTFGKSLEQNNPMPTEVQSALVNLKNIIEKVIEQQKS